MQKRMFLVTAVGRDRPGIVERVTRILVERSGNVEESRMARLGGDFAAFVAVSLPVERFGGFQEALEALGTEDLSVSVREMRGSSEIPAGHAVCSLEVHGADHEGIIHRIGALLAGKQVNVVEMRTTVQPSPLSGSPMFAMTASLEVPPGVPVSDLEGWLSDLADELAVQISLR